MRKKIFTFLLALAASVGLSWATVITWDQSKVSTMAMYVSSGSDSKASDGIEVTAVSTGEFVRFGGAIEIGNGEGSGGGYLTFTSSVGNITQIDINHSGEGGWSNANGDWPSPYYENFEGGIFRWSGTPAASITLTGDAPRYIYDITSIEFTIEDGGASAPSWVRDGDDWDDATKTLTVNSNPGQKAYQSITEIQHVVINNSVTSIDSEVFRYCTGLTSVTIPNSVTSIGYQVFNGCTGLTSVTIPNGITSIPSSLFYNCSSLTSVTIPNSVTSIANSAFYGCTGLTSVTIPNSVTSIDMQAFKGCTGLTSVTIPNSVTSIEYFAFDGCTNVTDVYCYPLAADLTWNIANNSFKANKATQCHVFASELSAYQDKFGTVNVTFVGDLPAPASNPHGECGAQGDNLLWELDPSTGVLTITGSGAMYDWTYDKDRPWYSLRAQITSVVLPSGITSLGKYAFRGTDIVSINMTENYPAGLTAINQEAFFSTQLTSVTIPQSVVTIGMDAFRESKIITDVYCYADPNNLTWNDYYCDDFKNADHATVCHVKACALSTYEANWGGTPYNVYNSTGVNVTFVGDLPGECPAPTPTPNPSGECGAQGDNLLWEFNPTTGELTITGSGAMADWPGNVERPWYDYRNQITSVSLPTGITSIGTNAFKRCTNLASINIAENYPASLTTIKEEAFRYTALTSFTIPATVVTIETDAFTESEHITDVYCYADPNNLTWNDSYCDDFIESQSKTTQCHVKNCHLDVFNTKWNTGIVETDVNVTFVGDLPGDCPAPTPTDEQVPTNADPENPSYHYSTFFHSTQNYQLTNDGTQAFIATLSNNDLVLTKIAEGTQVIPANTAVIFRKSGSAEPVVLNPTEENGVSVNPNDNSLKGVDDETAVTSIDGLTAANCYVLSGTPEHGVGFYKIKGNTLKAHKAYVIYNGSAAPKRMRFIFNQEQTATGVDQVPSDQVQSTKILRNGQLVIIKNGVKYNAQGQIVK